MYEARVYPADTEVREKLRKAHLEAELAITRIKAEHFGQQPRCSSGEHAKCSCELQSCLCKCHEGQTQ